MDWGGSLKISTHITQRWPSKARCADYFPSLSQGKVKVGCWLFGGSVVKSQLHPKVLKLKSSDIIWTGVVHTKFQLIWTKNEEVLMRAQTKPSHYFREK